MPGQFLIKFEKLKMVCLCLHNPLQTQEGVWENFKVYVNPSRMQGVTYCHKYFQILPNSFECLRLDM